MSDDATMTALVPVTIRNQGAAPLVVKVAGLPDKTVAPGKEVESHSEQEPTNG